MIEILLRVLFSLAFAGVAIGLTAVVMWLWSGGLGTWLKRREARRRFPPG